MKARDLFGSTLVLVDVNERNLELIGRYAKMLAEGVGADYGIEVSTDRRAAARGADFVIISVEVDRWKTWPKDIDIPWRYGVYQVLGENGGPGGLAHSLRIIPPVVEICQDVKKLSPGAWILNLTNPMSRVCRAIQTATGLKFIGFCHGPSGTLRYLTSILKLSPDDLRAKVGGINHFSWLTDLRFRRSGKDAYPALRSRLKQMRRRDFPKKDGRPFAEPLSREMFDSFGMYPCSGDTHIAEYLPFCHRRDVGVWDKYDFRKKEFPSGHERRDAFAKMVKDLSQGKLDARQQLKRRSGETVVDVISAILHDRREFQLSLNVPNRGCLDNLDQDAVVEVSSYVDGNGVSGVHLGSLPPVIASWCRTQGVIHDLTVEAALKGCRKAAYEALLLDPVIESTDVAKKVLNALLRANKKYLPRFR